MTVLMTVLLESIDLFMLKLITCPGLIIRVPWSKPMGQRVIQVNIFDPVSTRVHNYYKVSSYTVCKAVIKYMYWFGSG